MRVLITAKLDRGDDRAPYFFTYDHSELPISEEEIYIPRGIYVVDMDYDGWKAQTIDGLEESTYEIFTAERGVGNGDIVIGKRKKAVDIDIVARAFPGLNGKSSSVSPSDKCVEAREFHEAAYDYMATLTIMIAGRMIQTTAKLMRYKIEQKNFRGMPVITATYRLMDGEYGKIKYSTELAVNRVSSGEGRAEFPALIYNTLRDGADITLKMSNSSGWNDIKVNFDFIDENGNLLSTRSTDLIKTTDGVQKFCDDTDITGFTYSGTTKNKIVLDIDWFNATSWGRINAEMTHYLDGTTTVYNGTADFYFPAYDRQAVDKVLIYMTGTVNNGTRLINSSSLLEVS